MRTHEKDFFRLKPEGDGNERLVPANDRSDNLGNTASRRARDIGAERVRCWALERADLSIQSCSHESIQAGISPAKARQAGKSHSRRDTQTQHKFPRMSAAKSAKCV